MRTDWSKLIGAVVLCEAAGAIGAIFTTPKIPAWYQFLDKPSWNPPAWVFGPVWTTLFLLMGIALYRVWQRAAKQADARRAAQLFAGHLVVNVLWSAAFFGLENPGLGVVAILLLLAYVWYLAWLFGKIDRLAGQLLWPYGAWVSFATLLNIAVWQLNR